MHPGKSCEHTLVTPSASADTDGEQSVRCAVMFAAWSGVARATGRPRGWAEALLSSSMLVTFLACQTARLLHHSSATWHTALAETVCLADMKRD